MSTELTIAITARDGTTTVFNKIAGSARTMGSSIQSGASQATSALTRVGSAGGQAASGMAKVDAAASKSASSMSRAGAGVKKFAGELNLVNSKGASAGAALTSLVGALSDAGRAAAAEEAIFERLEQSIEATGKAYDQYADQIDKAIAAGEQLAFADDKTAAALANLTQITGSADEALQHLGLAQDLARAKGLDLATASTLVGKVAAGNTGILARYGIVVAEGATAQEALAQMQTRFAGQAEAYAGTTAGALDRVRNAMDNQVEAVGAWVNEHGMMLTMLPGLSTGFTALGGVVGSIGGLLAKSASGAGLATTSFTSLAGAINPIGLALTAAGVAGGILVHSLMEQSASAADAQQSYVDLASAIDQVADAQARADLRSATIFQSSETEGAEGFFRNLGSTIAGTSRNLDEYTISGTEAAEANRLIGDTALKAGSSVGNYAGDVLDMREAVDSGTLTGDQLIATLTGLNKAFSYTGNGAAEVQAETMRIVDAWQAGDISAQGMADGISRVTADVGRYADALVPAIAATEQFTQAEREAAEAAIKRLAAQSRAALQPQDPSGALIHTPSENEINAIDLARVSTERLAEKEQEAAEAAAALQEAQRAVAAELRGQLVPALDGASSGFAGFVQPGEDVLDTLARLAPNLDNVGGSFLQFADNLNDAAQGMQSVLGMFDAIDGLASSAEKANDIAAELVGEPGVWSTLDDLVSNAAISQETYNRALDAGYGIQANNVAIQEDLNAVRAQQLPLLESQSAKLAAYVDGLASASAAEQQQALYLMDSANQAKVAAAYSTAYAASLGEIPEDVATQIIADGSQADPILGDILESFGLIEVGANGEISVNFPNKSTLDDVVTSVDRLAELSAIDLLIQMSGGEIAEGQVERVNQIVDELDGKTSTAKVAVEVDDSGLTSLDSALASGAGFGAGTGITVDVNANTEPLKAGIEEVKPAPIEVPVTYTSGGTGKEEAIARGTADFGGPITIDITANDNASSTIARVMQAANALSGLDASIALDADDSASSVVARAMQTVNAFDGLNATAQLDATDSASSIVARAMQAANAFAAGEYNASLVATDSASQIIDSAESNAVAFATTYTGTIAVTDNASGPIGEAQGAASAFATTYSATLNAVDNASAVIQSVSQQLDALNGKTAVTYVTTQEVASLPAKALGGAVLPGAAMGRNILVGEAGAEVVTLPFGAFVKPHGADGGSKPKSMLPDVDMAEAYKKGSDSAKAFYKGLFDEAKARLSDARSEIGSTRYGSEGEARQAIADYLRLERQAEQIRNKIDRAKAYDRRHREETLAETDALADETVSTMSAAGAEAGAAFSDEMTQSMDVGAIMDQVRQLKDEFVQTMRGSAGSVDGAASAVESFNQEIASIVGGLRAVDKSGDKALGGISKGFGAIEDDAEDMGETVGDELGSGITDGAKDATGALSMVADMMDRVSGQSVDPSVGIDSKSASQELKDVGAELSKINATSATPDIGVKVDDSEWQNFLDSVDDNARLGVTVTVRVKERGGGGGGGGRQLGGGIGAESLERNVPRAATGRVITVGEAGEEAVVLPYGAMVLPHDASRSRLRADAQTSGNIQIFGAVHIYPPTAELHAALSAQLMSEQR